jgi:hypothetical protein
MRRGVQCVPKWFSRLALIFHQSVASVVCRVSRMFDALSQLDSVQLKQRNIKEFAPVSGIVCGHDLPR